LTVKTAYRIRLLLSNRADFTSDHLLHCWFVTRRPFRYTVRAKAMKALILILQILLFCKTVQLQKGIHEKRRLFFSQEKTLWD